MSIQPPGVIGRFFRGIWNALNFTRRLLFNLIFVFVLILFIGALFGSRPVLSPRTALVLDPKGSIVEQYRTDPAQRALGSLSGNEVREVQLRDLLRVIDAAAKDSHIERIVLIPDEIDGVGLATVRELGAALDRFKATGKEVIAVSGGMGQNQYLLAAHANRILLDPDGAVLLEGLANYRSYFKDALDKLGVQVHLIKVGTFKSAAEPYILNQASDAAKEADSYWMGGLWQEYLAEIAALRKIDASKISDDIAHYDDRVTAHAGTSRSSRSTRSWSISSQPAAKRARNCVRWARRKATKDSARWISSATSPASPARTCRTSAPKSRSSSRRARSCPVINRPA